MGRGNKNRISGKVKKNSKFCSKIFGRKSWPEIGRKNFSGGAFGRDFGRKFLSKGVHRPFFQKIAIFLFLFY
jgi:hypothetical protein